MGGRPLPLWTYKRRGSSDLPVVPRPLDGDWRDEFALIYESAASRGIGPAECDASEIWVIAAALGANRTDETTDPLADTDGLSWNQRRAAAIERGEPEPSWDDVPLTAQERAQEERLAMLAQATFVPPEGMAAT